MLIEKLREIHVQQNISVPFEKLETLLYDIYDKQFKDKIQSIDDLLITETPQALLEYVFDQYVEKNSLSLQTPEWKKIQADLKLHPYFKNRPYVCAAPYNTLRFDFNGEISVCCQNRSHILGYYPDTTPHKAWFSSKKQILQKKISDFDFTLGCTTCARHILAGNARNSVLGQYNAIMPDVSTQYPKRLIFQLYNTCNYACIMCSEEYSSTIQKLRGSKAPCKNFYDDKFIDEIEIFLKNAVRAEFIGGEPFLTTINFKIWDRIKNINPNLTIDVITNGSVFNTKIEQLFNDLPNMLVHVSLDSLNPETYAYVRRNGDLQNVLNNIDKMFKLRPGSSISMSPIIQTVYEIPDMVNFCNKYNVDLSIRNVVDLISGPSGMYKGLYENGSVINNLKKTFSEEYIKEFRLKTLSKKEKLKIKAFLLSKKYPKKYYDVVSSFANFLMNYN